MLFIFIWKRIKITLYLLGFLLSQYLSHSISRFHRVVGQIEQEKVQRLSNVIKLLIFVGCSFKKSHPKRIKTRNGLCKKAALTLVSLFASPSSPLLELIPDVCVAVLQELHPTLLAPDIGAVLAEPLLQGAARLLGQVQIFAQLVQLFFFRDNVLERALLKRNANEKKKKERKRKRE